MAARGLVKLLEEAGELAQVCAKKAAYFHTDLHPDGAGSLKARIEAELGDVLAACALVCEAFALDFLGPQPPVAPPTQAVLAAGLVRLMRTLGELSVVAATLIEDHHVPIWQARVGLWLARLDSAVSSTVEACAAVRVALGLDAARIERRFNDKLALFRRWQADPANASEAFDGALPSGAVAGGGVA